MPVVVPPADDPHVSILLVVYGGAEPAVDAVASVVEHTDIPYEVIVVDNCSPDGSFETLTREIAGAVVVQAGSNLGFGGGNNRAAELARASVLVLLNPDTQVRAGWLEPLLRRLEAPEVAAVCPALIDEHGNVVEAGAVVDHWGNTAPPMRRDFAGSLDVGSEPFVVDYASAACLAIRADVFAELGGFDDAYRLAYYEDVDLCFRIWQRGLQVWCEPTSRVEHARGGGGDPLTAVELWNRNRSVFLTRWSPELEKRPALTGSDADLARLARWRDDDAACRCDGLENPTRAAATLASRGSRWSQAAGAQWGAWAAICAVALFVLERQHSPRTFFYDEWNFVFSRGLDVDSLLQPHNGHLAAIPIAVYRVGLAAGGLDRYLPFRLLGLGVHLLVATAVYVYVRRCLGGWVAAAVGALVAFLGTGWQNIFWPFQISFTGSLAAGVGAWVAIDRRQRRFDVAASVALVVALACSGLGIALLAGTAVRLAFERAWRRMVLVLTAPVLLYGLWYLTYGEPQGGIDNIPRVPRFAVDAAASGAGALFGRDLLWGRVLVGLVTGAALVLGAWQRRLRTAVLAPLAAAIVNWILIAYSRADVGEVAASRYAYVSAVLILLVLAELARTLPRRRLKFVAAVVAALGIWGNAAILVAGAGGYRESSATTRFELRALEWARDMVPPGYQPDPQRMPQVTAMAYFNAVADHGSAAAADHEFAEADPKMLLEVDRVSWESLGMGLSPPGPQAPLPASVRLQTDDDVVESSDGCRTLRPGRDSTADAVVVLPLTETLAITAATQPVDVRVRRFAEQFTAAPQVTVMPGDTQGVTFPADASPRREWLVDVTSTATVVLCGAGATVD